VKSLPAAMTIRRWLPSFHPGGPSRCMRETVQMHRTLRAVRQEAAQRTTHRPEPTFEDIAGILFSAAIDTPREGARAGRLCFWTFSSTVRQTRGRKWTRNEPCPLTLAPFAARGGFLADFLNRKLGDDALHSKKSISTMVTTLLAQRADLTVRLLDDLPSPAPAPGSTGSITFRTYAIDFRSASSQGSPRPIQWSRAGELTIPRSGLRRWRSGDRAARIAKIADSA